MTCALAGMSEALVVTEVILSFSIRTMALLQSLPLPSQSLPNLTAFACWGPVVCAAAVAAKNSTRDSATSSFFMRAPDFWNGTAEKFVVHSRWESNGEEFHHRGSQRSGSEEPGLDDQGYGAERREPWRKR